MPNYCTNEFMIRGEKNDVFAMFQKIGFKGNTANDLDTFINENVNNITMRSWFPMPQTFVDYDTTNSKLDKETKKRNKNGRLVKMFKTNKEYENYSKAYDDAVKYQKETYGVVGWYDYNMHTLGVKWDAKVFEYGVFVRENSKGEIVIESTFDTAWDAPTTWLKSLAEEFPKLFFKIDGYEPGMGFHVYIECEDGVLTNEFSEDYTENDEFEDEDNF